MKNPPLSKRQRRLNPADVAAALKAAKGFKTAAARMLGCGLTVIYNYIKQYPEVAAALDEAHQELGDFTEGKLFEKIKAGDSHCIIFCLKTRFKDRGYVERQEMTGPDGGPIRTKSDDITDDEIDRLLATEAARLARGRPAKGK